MTRRPGRIKERLEVPFSRPRSYELIGNPDFAALRARIVSSLRDEWLEAQE